MSLSLLAAAPWSVAGRFWWNARANAIQPARPLQPASSVPADWHDRKESHLSVILGARKSERVQGTGVTEWSAIVEIRSPERGRGLAEQAHLALREAILNHQFPPGTRLSVPEMARRLGISRSPAREAIARVADEGLARMEPNRGAVVTTIRVGDLVEIYSLREVLEGLACRLACERLTQENGAELSSIVEAHEIAVTEGNVERHYELDQRFHGTIRRVAGNGRLSDTLDRLQGQIRVAMRTTHRSSGGMKAAVAEHRAMLDALLNRTPEEAEQAARRHVSRLLGELRDTSEETGEIQGRTDEG